MGGWWRWLVVAGMLQAGMARADLVDTVALELRTDDNLSRAQLDRDIKGDIALAASADGGTAFQIGDSGRLKLSVTLGATAHREYQGLDRLEAGLAASYRHKFGLGAYAPVLVLGASATRLDYRDRFRDGWRYGAEIGVQQRITDRLGIHLDYLISVRRSDRIDKRVLPWIAADVYDLDTRSLRFGGDYLLAPQYVLTAGFALHKGDIVSTTLRNLPIFLASDAIAADDAFGPNRFAYRLPARTRDLELGVSRLIGRQSSMSLGYSYLDSRGEGGIDYQANLFRATYLRQF